jgi:hypothetical protein
MDPPDSIVDNAYIGRQRVLTRCLEVPDNLRAETVVAEEHIADPGDQYLLAHPGSLRSSPR